MGDSLPDGNNVPDGVMPGKKPSSPEYSLIDSNGKMTEYGKWYYERPGWRQKTIKDVWENAKDPEGKVYDKFYPEKEIIWDKTKSRGDQWHMGHKQGYEFSKHQQSDAQRQIGAGQ